MTKYARDEFDRVPETSTRQGVHRAVSAPAARRLGAILAVGAAALAIGLVAFLLLPKLGFSVNEANLVEWMVADGATVAKGDPLYALESEKSVQEIDAPTAGVVKILKPAGEVYLVGTVIGEIA